MIPIAKPYFGDEEKKAIASIIDSGMIASGVVVEEFNKEFAAYVGLKHGIAVSNGTTALEVALRALNIGPGDKVLTTPFSFIASTNCIIYTGATPVFADIEPDTYNISAEKIEQKLIEEPDIKALLLVHLFGQTCEMDSILTIVKKYDILLIEDCAQAHGALYKGRKAGTFGDIAAFSFYATKNLATGEGGMILTNDNSLAERSRLLINHGMKVRYYHDFIGYNYRMTNIAAAIGLCQLKKLDAFNKSRNTNAEFFNKEIRNPLIKTPHSHYNGFHCYHQYTIAIEAEKREDFLKYLTENKIGHGIFYPLSIPEQKCYTHFGFEQSYPVTDKIKNEVISIPVHPMVTQEGLKTIVEVINAYE